MAFAVVAVADEGGIQTDADRRLRRRRLGQGRVAKLLADFQRMMAKCFRARAGLASRPGDWRVRSAISRWLAACLLKSSITISACWPRSRKYSEIVKPANGAIHCNPAALDDSATTTMQRSGAPWLWMASIARRMLELFWPTAT